jgi:hypothetical protein
VWVNNNGKDITFQFFFENSTAASIESFRKKLPSPVFIETIEPSVLWWIHKKDADRIAAQISVNPSLRDIFINALFERAFDYMKRFSFIKDTSTQCYLSLIERKPQIVQCIPQHYIIFHLGVSTGHFSRMQNKLAMQKHEGEFDNKCYWSPGYR